LPPGRIYISALGLHWPPCPTLSDESFHPATLQLLVAKSILSQTGSFCHSGSPQAGPSCPPPSLPCSLPRSGRNQVFRRAGSSRRAPQVVSTLPAVTMQLACTKWANNKHCGTKNGFWAVPCRKTHQPDHTTTNVASTSQGSASIIGCMSGLSLLRQMNIVALCCPLSYFPHIALRNCSACSPYSPLYRR
jgi:hypothetical protein